MLFPFEDRGIMSPLGGCVYYFSFFSPSCRSSRKLLAANTLCMIPPLEQDGPWKTRPLYRMTDRSWTTCWVNWGTNGTLFVGSQWKGEDFLPMSAVFHSAKQPHCEYFVLFCRQNKLEEALLFSGQFTDALQALIDWLYRVEPQLAEDQPVHGDIDLVLNLIDNHKVENSSTPKTQDPFVLLIGLFVADVSGRNQVKPFTAATPKPFIIPNTIQDERILN